MIHLKRGTNEKSRDSIEWNKWLFELFSRGSDARSWLRPQTTKSKL